MDVERRALIVGVDRYEPRTSDLGCAVRDAERIEELLQRNEDDSVNYYTELMCGRRRERRSITRLTLKERLTALLDNFRGDALFYFSGHGHPTPFGTFLVTQDTEDGAEGVSMGDLLLLANKSPAREVVIVLDCCYAGAAGNPALIQAFDQPVSLLREGVTILASSRHSEVSWEVDGNGMFCNALSLALDGAAADHLGRVTAPAAFQYASRFFGAWDQRPVFKTHSEHMAVLRTCRPRIAPELLREMHRTFPGERAEIVLTRWHEANAQEAEANQEVREALAQQALFRQLRDAGLLRTVKGDDLYWAAQHGNPVRLTRQGRLYWQLCDAGRL